MSVTYTYENDGNPDNDQIYVTLKSNGIAGIPLVDGEHSWYVKAVDDGGATKTLSSRSFIVDATSPTITAPAISNSFTLSGYDMATTSTSPAITTTVSDTQGLATTIVTLEKQGSFSTAYSALESRTYVTTGTSSNVLL